MGKAVIAALALLIFSISSGFAPTLRAYSQVSDSEMAFVNAHWPDTIPLQGPAPTTYSALEASLAPKDCGACHKTQYDDWKTSIHSQSMGAGVLGQIVNFVERNRATARICWSCHTPLAEQQNVLYKNNTWISNAEFDSQLQSEGLVCAACHVRKHKRFGPTKMNNTTGAIAAQTKLPHDGFVEKTVFSKSVFCRKCHQFDDGGYKLNGKLIENTYNEWKDSKYATMGIQCQDCHMPNRRHLWRGIHDQEMVQKAVEIAVIPTSDRRQADEPLETQIQLPILAPDTSFQRT
ncbi:MAG: multiheme c-type cytochrome [Gammaproteobacteria bacterium]|nr:multiheme c-type cytochrome [Gammaproteobacteria bacterium]MDH3465576.1 multiheme c-type cytochrome [Gammaproteobacteria bacterium]